MASGNTTPSGQAAATTGYYESIRVAGHMALVAAVQLTNNVGGTSGVLTATLEHSITGGVDSAWKVLEEIGTIAYNATDGTTIVQFYPQPATAAKAGFLQYVRIKVVTDADSGAWEFIPHLEAKGK